LFLLNQGFYITAQSYINALVTAWQSADLFLVGTQITFNTLTNQLSFTHIVPLFAAIGTTSQPVRYWFRPVNNAAFTQAWTDQGLQNLFNNPPAYGPPPVGSDVTFDVTSANYNTVVVGQAIPFFSGATPPVITSSWQMVSTSTAALVVPQTNVSLILAITIPSVLILLGIIVVAIVLGRQAADHAAANSGKEDRAVLLSDT
jgi:hypothetical protein